jgi:hypothetical protein
VEHAFSAEEQRYCGLTELGVLANMTAAIASFDDALLALKVVQNAVVYREADKTYAHHPNYRYHNMPKDAFHNACIAHRTRLNNILRAPGINTIERDVYEQRAVNMGAAQNVYAALQKKALEKKDI